MVANSADMLDDTLLGFLLGKSGDEHFMMETVIVFVKDPITMEDFTIEAFMGETSLDIKEKIYRMTGYPIEQQRLVFAGHQTADLGTISSHNIQTGNKIHVNMSMHGGAKKGVKKLTKQEKPATLKAKIMYKASLLTQPSSTQLLQHVTTPGYIANRVGLMNLEQIRALKTDAEAADNIRSDRVPKACYEKRVPKIIQMKASVVELENAIQALEDAVETAFIEDYFDNGLDLKPFFTMINDREIELLAQAQREDALAAAQAQAQAEAQAFIGQQMAQMQAAAQAAGVNLNAPAADDMEN